MPASVSRRVTIAFLVSAFLAVIAGALGISFAVRSSDASRTALKTLLPAAATANQLLADVVDQETGERGFVITDDRLFLQPYDLGQIEAPGLIATLERELVGHKIALALLAQVDVALRGMAAYVRQSRKSRKSRAAMPRLRLLPKRPARAASCSIRCARA